MKKLLKMYERTLNVPYKKVDPYNVEYYTKRVGSTLYIDFKWTNSGKKWLINFQWWAKPYKDMNRSWAAHSGFLRCWKTVEPYIAIAIGDMRVKRVRIVGYSHGGALAMLCHEFVWFHRPDLRENLSGYGFGAPKVFAGFRIPKELKERWNRFTIVRLDDDIVSSVPPFYSHVGRVITIGSGLNHPIKSHFDTYYIETLKIF